MSILPLFLSIVSHMGSPSYFEIRHHLLHPVNSEALISRKLPCPDDRHIISRLYLLCEVCVINYNSILSGFFLDFKPLDRLKKRKKPSLNKVKITPRYWPYIYIYIYVPNCQNLGGHYNYHCKLKEVVFPSEHFLRFLKN